MPVVTAAPPDRRRRITILAAVTLGLGLLALLAPLGGSESPASRVGALLGIAATIEALHSLTAIDGLGAPAGARRARSSAWRSRSS